MNLVTGTIDNVKVNGPFQSQFVDKETGLPKQFFANELTIEDVVYTYFTKENETPPSEGTLVKILFEEITSKSGKPTNKITKLEVQANTSTISKSQSKRVETQTVHVGKQQSPLNKSSSYDPKGARIGMIAKAGLDLATARHDLTVEGILRAAQDMEQVVTQLEQDNN